MMENQELILERIRQLKVLGKWQELFQTFKLIFHIRNNSTSPTETDLIILKEYLEFVKKYKRFDLSLSNPKFNYYFKIFYSKQKPNSKIKIHNLNENFTFGKYEGESIRDISNRFGGYILSLIKNCDDFVIDETYFFNHYIIEYPEYFEILEINMLKHLAINDLN